MMMIVVLLLRVCYWENIVLIWENIVWYSNELDLHYHRSHPNHPYWHNEIILVELEEIFVYSSNEYFPKDSLVDHSTRQSMINSFNTHSFNLRIDDYHDPHRYHLFQWTAYKQEEYLDREGVYSRRLTW